jgi:mitogen-activated protein kinase kinase 7
MSISGIVEENKRILMDLEIVLKSNDCHDIVKCLGYLISVSDVWICMELMTMCFDKLLKQIKSPIPEPILGKLTVSVRSSSITHYIIRLNAL